MRKQFLKYALLCLILFLVACGKNEEYTQVIPQDVDCVVVLDCQRIMEESGLLSSENGDLQQNMLEPFKKHLSLNETAFFEQLVTNPSDIGVEWQQKAFFFSCSQSKDKVVLFPVSDSAKLKTSLLTFAGPKLRGHKFIEEEGYDWASTRNYHIALNDKVCLFIINSQATSEELKQRVALWLSQNKNESFASSKYYDDLTDIDGEIGLFASMTALHENISMLSSLIYSEEMDVSSLKYMADISFKEGKVVANGKILYEDPKFRDWIREQDDVLKKLEGTSLAYLPKSTPTWFSVGLDGDELYDHLLEHPTYGSKLKNLSISLDLAGLIRSMDGDFNIAYPYGMFVDVKNDQILRICVSAIQTMGRFIGLSIDEGEKNQYVLNDQNHRISNWLHFDEQLSIGMKGDSFYFLITSNGTHELTKEESLASLPWAEEVDGNKLFFALNVTAFSKLMTQHAHKDKKVKTAEKYIDYVTYSQKDIDTNTFVISFVDQDRNVLEQLLELGLKIF